MPGGAIVCHIHVQLVERLTFPGFSSLALYRLLSNRGESFT
jgi:hypothetical protein